MSNDAASLDPEVLESLRDLAGPDDPNFFADLVGQFLAHADGAITGLRVALAAGDAKGVERIAHGLKGSSGNMGAKRMQSLCSELQKSGTEGALARAAPLIDSLATEYKTVRALLAAEANKKIGQE